MLRYCSLVPFALALLALSCSDPGGGEAGAADQEGGASAGGSGSGGRDAAVGGDAASAGGARNAADGGSGPAGGASPSGTGASVGTGGSAESLGGTGGDGSGDGGAPGNPGSGGAAESSAPQIYQDLCSECHGPVAEGVTTKGPAIVLAAPEMVEYLVRFGDDNETVTNQGAVVGDPLVMKPNPPVVVSDEDITAISDWLATLPRPTTGAGLFAAACSYCHGTSGKGGDTEYATAYHSAPFSRQDANGFASYVLTGHTSENGVVLDPSERRKYMPPFQDLLSDEEIALIFQWASAQ